MVPCDSERLLLTHAVFASPRHSKSKHFTRMSLYRVLSDTLLLESKYWLAWLWGTAQDGLDGRTTFPFKPEPRGDNQRVKPTNHYSVPIDLKEKKKHGKGRERRPEARQGANLGEPPRFYGAISSF